MPAPQFRDNYYNGRRAAATVSAVNTSFTTTGLATIKAPSSGKTLRVFAIRIQAYVTTILSGATAGDPLLLVDNVIGSPVGEFRFNNVGTATRAAQGGYIVSATDATTVHYGWCENDWGLSGLKLGAADNVLKVGLANTITTGVIAVRGWVLTGEE